MNRRVIYIFLWSLILSVTWSCEDNDGNETQVSRNNDTESHNTGSDCITCHKAGGDGEGWFNVSGSVYGITKSIPEPNGKINIYTKPNGAGSLYAIVEVDGKGNFYTTENIEWGEGLYVSVEGTGGNIQHMATSVKQGACNSCHDGRFRTGSGWNNILCYITFSFPSSRQSLMLRH